MKILHCIKTLGSAGGSGRDFIEQVSALQSRYNFAIEVVCLDNKTDPWLKNFGATVHALGPDMAKSGYSKKYWKWLKKNCAKFDAVVVHGAFDFIPLSVWWALRNEEKPPYFIFPHGALDRWYAYRYPLLHFAKLFYWSLIGHRVFDDAKAVLFTSTDEANQSRRAFTPYEFTQLVVSSGTTAPTGDEAKQQEAFYAQFPHLKGKPYLLFLGKLHERKGIDVLIEAFADVAKHNKTTINLVIAGTAADAYGQQLHEQAAELAPELRDRIVFTGLLSGDVKWGALRAADALILTAHQATMARSVKEALALGKPILISNKASIWMEIAQTESGLVEPDDVEGAVKLIERWLSLPAGERKDMSDKAKQLFLRRFEDQKFFPKYLAILEGKSPEKPREIV